MLHSGTIIRVAVRTFAPCLAGGMFHPGVSYVLKSLSESAASKSVIIFVLKRYMFAAAALRRVVTPRFFLIVSPFVIVLHIVIIIIISRSSCGTDLPHFVVSSAVCCFILC